MSHFRTRGGRHEADLIDKVVITTGREAYRTRDGIAVIPAGLLGP